MLNKTSPALTEPLSTGNLMRTFKLSQLEEALSLADIYDEELREAHFIGQRLVREGFLKRSDGKGMEYVSSHPLCLSFFKSNETETYEYPLTKSIIKFNTFVNCVAMHLILTSLILHFFDNSFNS